jgi:hypothetical protein
MLQMKIRLFQLILNRVSLYTLVYEN